MLQNYIPPFKITNLMLERISSIMKKIGQLDNYKRLNKMPILRKNNRIKSIHSSLAIEANSLSFEQVRDIIDGKIVLGDITEIQEVQNAYDAYLKIRDVDPYSVNDLKQMHKILTQQLIKDAGDFRVTGEGVFDENGKCIFVCPPPSQVVSLVNQLFQWMQEAKDEIHPLILSSVFHYEFVFIHPFIDGNGRTARLWQNIILTNWEPVFEYVPIESEIMIYQEDYYLAIQKCNNLGESTEFIEFMLKMIDETLDRYISGLNNQIKNFNPYVSKILSQMEPDVLYTTTELMNLLGMKSRISFRKNYLIPAINQGLIKLRYPETPTTKNQSYYKI